MPCARVASLLILNDEIRAPVVYPMSSLAAATLVIGVLLLVGVPILWLIFNSGTLTPVERDAATREFEFQLQHPEFAALEAHSSGPQILDRGLSEILMPVQAAKYSAA